LDPKVDLGDTKYAITVLLTVNFSDQTNTILSLCTLILDRPRDCGTKGCTREHSVRRSRGRWGV